jgi:glycosyltransferase involved in cell wall biosynthesis
VRLQIQLSKKVDFVIAVGKKLYDEISTQLSGVANPPKITQFNPGILSDESYNTPKVIAPKPFCLVLGRVEDFELKGVDIAAKALDIVNKSLNDENKPVLVIRGAQVGTGDELKKRVQQIALDGLEIRTKEYSANLEIIKEEINRASVVLMPSRTEGFGLVGLEAIEAKCPVLISSNSGLAKMLKIFAPSHADNWIVTTTGNLEQDAEEWAKRIKLVLADRVASNRMMEELFNHLKDTLTWSNSVAEMTSHWLN